MKPKHHCPESLDCVMLLKHTQNFHSLKCITPSDCTDLLILMSASEIEKAAILMTNTKVRKSPC